MSTNGAVLVIERILRDRRNVWQQIIEERDLNRLTGQMLASSAIALACYGAVLGAFHSFLMALTSAVKLPMLFLITLAICLPTLYLFNLVFGARLSVRQALALVMVAITVTAVLAVAFAPISLFFLITAPDYGFFKLLNVAVLTLSALVGLRFLTGGMHVLNEHGLLTPAAAGQPETTPAVAGHPEATPAVAAQSQATPAAASPVATPAATPAVTVAEPVAAVVGSANGGVPAVADSSTAAVSGAGVPPQPVPAAQPAAAAPGHPRQPASFPPGLQRPALVSRPASPHGAAGQPPASMTLLYIWIVLFGFVGTQLGWTLRPFFGSPGEPFALFRSIEGNFYAEILRTIANL